MIAGNQLDLQVGDGHRLIAFVGYDDEDGQESMLREVDGEDLRLLGIIVGIGGDGDFFIAMKVVGGIGEGRLCDRLDETFARQQYKGEQTGQERDQENLTAAPRERPLHADIIEGEHSLDDSAV